MTKMTVSPRLYLMCTSLWTGPTSLQSLNLHRMNLLFDTLSQRLGSQSVTICKSESYVSISLKLPYGCTIDLMQEYGFTLARRFTPSFHSTSFVYESYDFPATFWTFAFCSSSVHHLPSHRPSPSSFASSLHKNCFFLQLPCIFDTPKSCRFVNDIFLLNTHFTIKLFSFLIRN